MIHCEWTTYSTSFHAGAWIIKVAYFSSLIKQMCTSTASYCTSVTVVLWKVSLLYTHPWRHGTRSVRLLSSKSSDEKQEESERLKFRLSVPRKWDWFPATEIELSRQWWGGVDPVKMLTIIWKARRIWGKQIHMYKIFWYLPKPPTAERIWSKFIFGKYRSIWRLYSNGPTSGKEAEGWQQLVVNIHQAITQRGEGELWCVVQEVNSLHQLPCASVVSPVDNSYQHASLSVLKWPEENTIFLSTRHTLLHAVASILSKPGFTQVD